MAVPRVHGNFLLFLQPWLGTAAIRRSRAFSPIDVYTTKRFQVTEAISHQYISGDASGSPTHLDPHPSDYGRTIFADKAIVTLCAGSGGHGCVSFLREKYIEHGPANGGDGGSGGNIYIQAVRGETSLHKLSRRRLLKAGRGKNGQGKGKGGQRGEDVLIQVPVGTVVREVSRHDPVAEEEDQGKFQEGSDAIEGSDTRETWRRNKWILYPSAMPSEYTNAEFPALPRMRKSNLTLTQPQSPILLDLSEPMDKPMLLAAGAMGGLGNPHFATRAVTRPKFATTGETGLSITLELELKLIADVGFVGMPNAGKSTLLRALSRSRARVGDWAFTTLQPNIGTMVLDNSRDRPQVQLNKVTGESRTQVSMADIPGLVKDAHLDKGLGLGFLRHIERAQILAFVIDLHDTDAVEALKGLWRELGEFEKLRGMQTNAHTESRIVDWKAFGQPISPVSGQEINKSLDVGRIIMEPSGSRHLPRLPTIPISSKPWFVIATKADLEGTQENFACLQAYLHALADGSVEHPSGNKNAWKGDLTAIPVSAVRGEGVERIPGWTVSLLDA